MITLVYGVPGMGKTTWMHDYLRAHARAHRFFVVDHAAEWGEDAVHWRDGPPPLTIFEREDEPEDFEESGIYIFRGKEPLDVARLVLDIGDTTFVDDEIDFTAGKRDWSDSPVREIVHRGRHAENRDGEFTQVNIIGACRRPQSLHTDLTDIADQVCMFRLQGSRTLERLKNDSMIEDEDWDTVRTLPKFHFKHWPSGDYMSVAPIGDKEDSSKEEGRKAMEQNAPKRKISVPQNAARGNR